LEGGEELPLPQAFKPSKRAASPAAAILVARVRKKLIGNTSLVERAFSQECNPTASNSTRTTN